MKKFLVCLILLSFSLPSYAWFWDGKDKALQAELEGKGYAGTLPNLDKVFKKKEQKVSTPIYESKKDFKDPADLKPVPENDPAFINIISKKDKTSAYYLDAQEMIPLLEKLADTIEANDNVQLFVTRANVLTMNIDHLIKKYEGQPESYYESFKKLLDVNRYAKTLVELRKEAVVYQRYLAYQTTGSVFNPENINQQLQYLLEEINTAVLLLRGKSVEID